MTLAKLTLVLIVCITKAERTPDTVVTCEGVHVQALPAGLRASHSVEMWMGAPRLGVADQTRHRAIYDAALRSGYTLTSTQVVTAGTPPFYELEFALNVPR